MLWEERKEEVLVSLIYINGPTTYRIEGRLSCSAVWSEKLRYATLQTTDNRDRSLRFGLAVELTVGPLLSIDLQRVISLSLSEFAGHEACARGLFSAFHQHGQQLFLVGARPPRRDRGPWPPDSAGRLHWPARLESGDSHPTYMCAPTRALLSAFGRVR